MLAALACAFARRRAEQLHALEAERKRIATVVELARKLRTVRATAGAEAAA